MTCFNVNDIRYVASSEHASNSLHLPGNKVKKKNDAISSGHLIKTLALGALLGTACAAPVYSTKNSGTLSSNLTLSNDAGPIVLSADVNPLNNFDATKYFNAYGEDLSKSVNAPKNEQNESQLKKRIEAAIQSKNYDMLSLKLKDKNIDLNHPIDEKGRTFLHIAVQYNFPGGIKALVEAGADLNQGDKLGLTPLHHAAILKSLDAIKLLGKFGADPNKLCKEGFAPVHLAIFLGEANPVKALLAIAGVDVNIGTGTLGDTPLHLLARGFTVKDLEGVNAAEALGLDEDDEHDRSILQEMKSMLTQIQSVASSTL